MSMLATSILPIDIVGFTHRCVKQFASPQHHSREIICSVSFTSNAMHSIKASKGLADSSLFILNIYINAL